MKKSIPMNSLLRLRRLSTPCRFTWRITGASQEAENKEKWARAFIVIFTRGMGEAK